MLLVNGESQTLACSPSAYSQSLSIASLLVSPGFFVSSIKLGMFQLAFSQHTSTSPTVCISHQQTHVVT